MTLDQRYGYDQICETPEKETSYWANIPRIGDAYTQAINRTLLTNQPYPGDDRYPNPHPLDTDSRFIISRGFRSPRHYQIYDARCDFVIKIPMQLLENCLFDLSGWYSKRRAKATRRVHPSGTGSHHIGYILSEAAMSILEAGISSHFPNVNPSADLASMIKLGCIEEENPEEKDPEGLTITSKSNPDFSSGENHNINLSDMVSWGCMGDALQLRMNNVLLDSQPYPGDTEIWVENGYTN